MAGTAVLRIVVSSDSMKKATATSHGKSRLEASEGGAIDMLAGIKVTPVFPKTRSRASSYQRVLRCRAGRAMLNDHKSIQQTKVGVTATKKSQAMIP